MGIVWKRDSYGWKGDPSIPVIVDTWMKGLRDFDVDLAYEAMYKSATLPGAENLMRPDNDTICQKDTCRFVNNMITPYLMHWNIISQTLPFPFCGCFRKEERCGNVL